MIDYNNSVRVYSKDGKTIIRACFAEAQKMVKTGKWQLQEIKKVPVAKPEEVKEKPKATTKATTNAKR